MRVGIEVRPSARRRTRYALAIAGVLALTSGQAVLATTPAAATDGIAVHDIQGAAHRSPLTGLSVTNVAAIVTAVGRNGFWMQDPQPDANPATSEGIFVFTRTTPTVRIGDQVTVSGTVTEFRPGNEATNLTTTELVSPTVTVTGTATPPGATLLGPDGLTPPVPVRADTPGDVEQAGFDPDAHGLDFYESLEGMLVRVDDAVATGPRNRFGELSVLPGGSGDPRTVRGGVRYTYQDANTERVILDDVLTPIPTANTGDRLPGQVTGVLDYSFGNYKLLTLARPVVEPVDLPRERTSPQASNQLAVATYNVENLDPADPAAKFERLARGVTDHLASPDIIALEEIQDNSGPRNDGTTAADLTYAKLIDAIQAAGGPRYDFRQVDPQNLTDGGEPGGNIRVGFLFRTDLPDLQFVDRPGGGPTTEVDVVKVGNNIQLTSSPGRIDPTNPAFSNSRKPLAAEFKFRGKPVFVVANHWNSKGGDNPLFGRFQPPVAVTETQRAAQATAVADFTDRILTRQPGANVVIAGDLNDFDYSNAVGILTGTGMLDLPSTLPDGERYTYVFEGNSQVLDHILISPAIAARGYAYDVVHVNSEFADQTSDHEPQVARIQVK